MDMMNFKPELHVVERIRKDKFVVEQMNDFSNTWDHHHHQNIRNPNNLGLIGNLQNQNYQDYITTFNPPQGFTNLRSNDSYDQVSMRPSNVGDMFSRIQTLDRPLYVSRDTIDQYNSMMEDNQKGCVTVLGQNNVHNAVTVACSGNEMTKSSYHDHGSSSGGYREELMFLPSFGNQSVAHHASQWNHGSSSKESTNFSDGSHAYNKGFSLSLSTEVPKLSSFGDAGNATVSSTVNVHRLGPLGPFTGYASILKRSRFLQPAQKMLEEFCISFASKIIDISESVSIDNDDLPGYSNSSEPLEPKNRLKREKLLFLQEEVSKRYKLYNHQLQTVVSSFESVAGLSTAAPYISIALGQVSRSFKALRTAISEQLKQISSQYSSGGGDSNNGIQRKQKALIDNNVGFVESLQHHIWRPHRGLPEHAVTVLRAWLFDHFLHPYPTDTDKQVLATQTGLSRNQVSNWFINARVRLWKPMVEEIHMLETKATENTNTAYDMEPSNTADIASSSSPSHEQPLMELPVTKRARLEYVRDGNRDMMGFNRGLGNVSLTLELRHGVDNVIQSQQTHNHQFGTGGQMFHDFVS